MVLEAFSMSTFEIVDHVHDPNLADPQISAKRTVIFKKVCFILYDELGMHKRSSNWVLKYLTAK